MSIGGGWSADAPEEAPAPLDGSARARAAASCAVACVISCEAGSLPLRRAERPLRRLEVARVEAEEIGRAEAGVVTSLQG